MGENSKDHKIENVILGVTYDSSRVVNLLVNHIKTKDLKAKEVNYQGRTYYRVTCFDLEGNVHTHFYIDPVDALVFLTENQHTRFRAKLSK